MMAEKIAKTKRTLESLSPPKLTSRVEQDRHEEWIVHDELVDDAFEVSESSIESALVDGVLTLASSAHDPLFNPIPTGLGHVTLIYGLIPPMAGRNRVKDSFCSLFFLS